MRVSVRTPRVGALAVGCAWAFASACGSNASHVTAPPPDTQYWQLGLNHHAITLAAATAPYDTITLVATPLTATGSVLQWSGAPSFVVTDSTVLSVTAAGVITGIQPGEAGVVSSLTIGNLTLTDTAAVWVNTITPPAPVCASLIMQGTFGLVSGLITPNCLDASGNAIPNVAMYYWSSDSTVATIDQFGDVNYGKPGPVTFHVEATVYGITMTDSLPYTVGPSLVAAEAILSRTPTNSTSPESYFSPQTVTIPQGGMVVWLNTSGQMVDVVFDDSAAAQAVPPQWDPFMEILYGLDTPGNPNLSGNIAAFAPLDSTSARDGVGVRIRYFPQLGTVNYHSALYGTTGTVVVVDSEPSSVTTGRALARRATPPHAHWRH
jgi:hypothetical protein